MRVNGLDRLIADLGRVPVEVRREMRPALRAAGQVVVDDAKRRASWSSRIPAAISLRTSFAQRGAGVYLRVDTSQAPHARPYEGVRGRIFRHPVFGDRDVWVSQRTRPYFFPAAQAHGSDVAEAVDKAAASALRRTGF